MAVSTRLFTPLTLWPARSLAALLLLSACGSDESKAGNAPFPNGQEDAGYGFDDAGRQIFGYDDAGRAITGYDGTGKPIIGYDELGRGIVGYDDNGKPILADQASANDAAVRTLSIEPVEPTLNVTGEAATLSFSALLDGNALPKASWTMDNPLLGSIDEAGVFHSTGKVAGTAKITARYATYEATTTLHVVSAITHVEMTPGSNGGPATPAVSDAQKAALDGPAAGTDAAYKWLYPYDGTVFPRGLSAPELMFGGAASDAMLVTLKIGDDFSFKGYFGGRARPGVTLPADVWEAATKSADGMTAVDVEVKKLSGTSVVGPIKQQWRIAPGDMKGIVYYNTYSNGGAVMRIKPGENAQPLITGCTVCHSVSAEGNVLVAGERWGDSSNPVDSVSFDLDADGGAPQRYRSSEGRTFPFAGLTPDGKWLVSNGIPASGSPIRGLTGDTSSKLFDSKTGMEVPAPSFTSQLKYALTPAFSPDAKHLAFSWFEKNGSNSKVLGVMDVDLSMSPPAFSPAQAVATVTKGIVGWPSFVTDGKGILYQEGDRFDTNTHGGGASYGELRMVDLDTKAVNPLLALNGWRTATETYLPFGATEESKLNYEPSVLPVPVGGYYWVIFTSRRAYGSMLGPNGSVDNGTSKWGTKNGDAEVPSPRKKLWVAAIDLDYTGKVDPSHPAFYLPGQEIKDGNMRAYTSLPPCRADGDSCASGADCCGGFCRWEQAGDVGDAKPVCVPEPVGCSNVDESCKVDADCCGIQMGDKCINGRCAAPNVFLQ